MPETKKEGNEMVLNQTGVNPCVNHQTLQHPSAQPGNSESAGTSGTNLKRKALEAVRDPAEKKRMSNMKDTKDTKRSLDLLIEENNNLRKENNSLKTEQIRIKQTLQSGQEELKNLHSNCGHLKGELDRQKTVVELLSEDLANSNHANLQRENAHLNEQIDLLRYQINNPENSDTIQLERRKKQLEYEKMVLQLTVEALCERINNDEDDE